MNVKLKTKMSTELKLTEIQTLMQLSSKESAMRLAIAFSLKESGDPRMIDDKIVRYNIKEQDGNSYDRYTLFGNDEQIYKVMMEQQLTKKLIDLEFFPDVTNAHLERGIELLYSQVTQANNKEKFLSEILKIDIN